MARIGADRGSSSIKSSDCCSKPPTLSFRGSSHSITGRMRVRQAQMTIDVMDLSSPDGLGAGALGHGLDRGRRLPHGLGSALPGGGTGPSRHRRRLLDRPDAGDEPAVQGIRARDRARHLRRDCPRPKNYPGSLPHMLFAGSLVFAPPARTRSTCATGENGGRCSRARIGGTPTVRRATSTRSTIIRSCMWPSRTRWPTRAGPARSCRPKPNGSLPRAAGSTAPSTPGATNSRPAARHMANTWQGEFPRQNLASDGFERTSPVTAFPPNGYGMHDMIGNVWEWTTDWYSPKHQADAPKACCIPENPRGGREDDSYDPACPTSGFRARSSRAARISARRTTAAAIARPRAMRSRSTRPRATSVFAAFDAKLLMSANRGVRPCSMLA